MKKTTKYTKKTTTKTKPAAKPAIKTTKIVSKPVKKTTTTTKTTTAVPTTEPTNVLTKSDLARSAEIPAEEKRIIRPRQPSSIAYREVIRNVENSHHSKYATPPKRVSFNSKLHRHNQRVGIFVDVQNLYYSARHLYNAKVNFNEVMKRAGAGRQVIRAIAYVINSDVQKEKGFHDALEKIGFEVKAKDIQVFYGGAKKGDWDIGIAMDVMRLADKLDVIYLISGDGDFKDLLEHAKALGCRTEAMAFGRSASIHLKGSADEFVDMDKDKKRFLL